MIGTRACRSRASRRIAALVTLLNILSAAVTRADRHGPAARVENRARAMFDASSSADTIGLASVWSLVVRDSGRRAEVTANRFRDPAFGPRFPTDSVLLRCFRAYGRTTETTELTLDAGVAALRILENEELDSSTIRWVSSPGDMEPDPRILMDSRPIPTDGQYFLSHNGKFLLVLRSMPHAVNVRGETVSFGLLDYFDVSDPLRPRRIGETLEADGPLDSGAISEDGTRVAVQILIADSSTVGYSRSKVVMLEKKRRTLPAPRVVVPTTAARGLQFGGRYLFVGMQRRPAPVSVEMSTTETVSLYDLAPDSTIERKAPIAP